MSRYSVHAREQREDREAVGHMMDLGNRPTPIVSVDTVNPEVESLWGGLREILDREYHGNLTHANAVEGILRGVGADKIKQLRNYGRAELIEVMPDEVADAVYVIKRKR